ncbi:MAG: tetratricopeptide repeat protein, partial [Paludibacteraceae bacterium]|nr:tetratricopeptide repeat protein [Paludibacteraceae bacterium]
NVNPDLARNMSDSLVLDVRDASEYVNMKYDLLNVRLADKAYIAAKSDIVVKRLVEYFESEGNSSEKQEAFYYAGSVYRDLKDSPKALSYFLKSVEIGETGKATDSIMLRNAYSNLSYLFYYVQDYGNSLKYAEMEYDLSKRIGDLDASVVLHAANALVFLNRKRETKAKMDEAFRLLSGTKRFDASMVELVSPMLFFYSDNSDMQKADSCYQMLQKMNPKTLEAPILLSVGRYMKEKGNADSTIACYRRVLDSDFKDYDKREAARFLFSEMYEKGDMKSAAKYARMYVTINDSLDLGKRQALAATVNNEFQYHRNEREEQNLKLESKVYRMSLVTCIAVCITVFVLIMLFSSRRRARLLQKQLDLAVEVRKLRNDKDLMEKEREQLLEEKKNQNKMYLGMISASHFESNAGNDVIGMLRNSETSAKKLSKSEWRLIYASVDKMHPDFSGEIASQATPLTEKQIQFCYLLKIGLTSPQIQNMTGLARVTVWRWTKKFDWIVADSERKTD